MKGFVIVEWARFKTKRNYLEVVAIANNPDAVPVIYTTVFRKLLA